MTLITVALGISNLAAIALYLRAREKARRWRHLFRITTHTETRATQ